MGWTDDLESYGAREPLHQVPYLGGPLDHNDHGSSPHPRAHATQHTSSTTNLSRPSSRRSNNPLPRPSSVHHVSTRSRGEERRGRTASLHHARSVPSLPALQLTETGSTMTSHSMYCLADEVRVTQWERPTHHPPQVVTHTPPNSQSQRSAGSSHRHSQNSHHYGSSRGHSHSRRQKYHTLPTVASYAGGANIDPSTHYLPSQHQYVSRQLESSQSDQRHNGWSGGFQWDVQVPAGSSISFAQPGHYRALALDSPVSSFVGGFAVPIF